MDIYQRTSLRKRCTLMPIHAERIDYTHVLAWVTTSFPQHLPNKSKRRETWFSSILSDFSLQITCCLEYFVYFCIGIHLFRRDGRFCIFPLRPFSPPYRTTRHQLGTRKAPPSRDLARAYYIKCIPTEQYNNHGAAIAGDAQRQLFTWQMNNWALGMPSTEHFENKLNRVSKQLISRTKTS